MTDLCWFLSQIGAVIGAAVGADISQGEWGNCSRSLGLLSQAPYFVSLVLFVRYVSYSPDGGGVVLGRLNANSKVQFFYDEVNLLLTLKLL